MGRPPNIVISCHHFPFFSTELFYQQMIAVVLLPENRVIKAGKVDAHSDAFLMIISSH